MISSPSDQAKTAAAALIVGCGYTGRRLSARLAAAGRVVTVLNRTPAARQAGVRQRVWDLDRGPAPALERAPLVFYLVPPPRAGAGDPRLGRCLAALAGVRRLVYVSTSAVYGDCGGACVDETRPPRPDSDRGRRRLAAEALLRDWAFRHEVEWTILRVAAIFGPGRLPLARLRAAEGFLAEAHAAPGNRIFVEDLVECLLAAESPQAAARIYNVCDGDHRSSTAFAARVAALAGLAAPVELSPEAARARFSEARRSFLGESRRLDNGRIRAELGVAFTPLEAAVGASLEA